MSSASDARRIAGGSPPSELVHRTHPGNRAGGGPDSEGQAAAPFDPLRLCIFATISLLGWLGGPVAVAVFAAIGFAGYWKARRSGLAKSKCYLRDTRLVLAYLGTLLAAGLWGIYSMAAQLSGP